MEWQGDRSARLAGCGPESSWRWFKRTRRLICARSNIETLSGDATSCLRFVCLVE